MRHDCRGSVLECAGPPALSSVSRQPKSSRGLEHSKTLSRITSCHLHACSTRKMCIDTPSGFSST